MVYCPPLSLKLYPQTLAPLRLLGGALSLASLRWSPISCSWGGYGLASDSRWVIYFWSSRRSFALGSRLAIHLCGPAFLGGIFLLSRLNLAFLLCVVSAFLEVCSLLSRRALTSCDILRWGVVVELYPSVGCLCYLLRLVVLSS